MNKSDLLKILKTKITGGNAGTLSITKNTSRPCYKTGKQERVTILYDFELSDFWSDGFVFKNECEQHILNVINNKFCETIIN